PTGPQAVPANMTTEQGPKSWFNAWSSLDLRHALTPVKLEQLKPELQADAVKAFAGGNLSFFSRLSAAYGTERILVAYAEPDLGAKRLNVTLVGQDSRGSIHWTRGYRIDLSDPVYTVEAAAVISLGVMEGRWKGAVSRPGRIDLAATIPQREPTVGGGWASSIETPGSPTSAPSAAPAAAPGGPRQTLSVEFRGMGEWTEISRKLSATQGLEELDVVGMNQRGARLTARVTASFEDIQRALAGQGLALRNTGGQWVVSQQ
ncbi:MAG: hypothetical protein RL291_2135, partial [Pseudomonadota bacterium]